ncbi:MAG: hypothetical protein CMJ98_07525 [Planctomycetes bacterium]|nr:hypothetical protein [Planctomycetota bacterium]HJM56436.1 radical SAM protein [Planctomycetota bacterium]
MKPPSLLSRVARHSRLSWRALGYGSVEPPPFLTVFINSICNLTCEHCFYWQQLNKRDDLNLEEFKRLSSELGPVEILNISGGEPYLQPDFAEIVELFVKNNGVRQIYVPTNGYFTKKTEEAMRAIMNSCPELDLFVNEFSLDGTPEFHNTFRGNAKSFEKAMETYDMLAGLQEEDERFRIHTTSTATGDNLAELKALCDLLYERCPKMDHHGIAIIRGDRKNPSLEGPELDTFRELYEYTRSVWAVREEGRFGAMVEPMLQWAKTRTAEKKRQVVHCTAGKLTGVVHANGDVSVCETHKPIGNLRQSSFREIWCGPAATELRRSIRACECWCTQEIAMWPSIVFQPFVLGQALVAVRPWPSPSRNPLAKAGPHE